MALFLAAAITVITLVSMYFFAAKTWWFPPYISEYGQAYDQQFMLTMAICGIIFFLAQLGLAYAIFRYRTEARKCTTPTGTTPWKRSGLRRPR